MDGNEAMRQTHYYQRTPPTVPIWDYYLTDSVSSALLHPLFQSHHPATYSRLAVADWLPGTEDGSSRT